MLHAAHGVKRRRKRAALEVLPISRISSEVVSVGRRRNEIGLECSPSGTVSGLIGVLAVSGSYSLPALAKETPLVVLATSVTGIVMIVLMLPLC